MFYGLESAWHPVMSSVFKTVDGAFARSVVGSTPMRSRSGRRDARPDGGGRPG